MTRYIKFLIVAVILICVVGYVKPVMAEEVTIRENEYIIELESNLDKEYNEISFDPYMYNKFKNFIIEDDKGKMVPYFIMNRENQISSDNTRKLHELHFEKIDSHKDDLYYYIDFQIIKEDDDKDEYINEVNIVSNEDFYKDIMILGSNDKINWERLASGSLYDISSNDKANGTTLYFEPVFYKYYRLQTEGIEKIIPFEMYSYAIDEKSIDEENDVMANMGVFDKTLSSNYKVEELVSENSNVKKSQTKITISGLKTDLPTTMKNINVKSIEFDIHDENFERYVFFLNEDTNEYLEYFYEGDYIKKVSLGKDISSKLKLSIEYVNDNEDLYIIINNEFDEQLKINDIKVTYYYEKIIFESTDTNKYLVKSINNVYEKPVYDINQLEYIILADDRNIINSYKIIDVENIFEVEKDYTFIYNFFFVVVSIILIVILIYSFRNFKLE